MLVGFGARVNDKSNLDKTPLVVAAKNGHVEMVKVLVELGADANDKGRTGRTTLHIAAEEGQVEVVRLLIGELGVDVHAKDKKGETPLHFAAKCGHAGVVRALLELGADAGSKDLYGRTAQVLAEQNKRQDVLKVLKLGW